MARSASIERRLEKLESETNRTGGTIFTPAPDGALPIDFRPGIDGIDLWAVPADLPLIWRGNELDELDVIAGPRRLLHEDALMYLEALAATVCLGPLTPKSQSYQDCG